MNYNLLNKQALKWSLIMTIFVFAWFWIGDNILKLDMENLWLVFLFWLIFFIVIKTFVINKVIK